MDTKDKMVSLDCISDILRAHPTSVESGGRRSSLEKDPAAVLSESDSASSEGCRVTDPSTPKPSHMPPSSLARRKLKSDEPPCRPTRKTTAKVNPTQEDIKAQNPIREELLCTTSATLVLSSQQQFQPTQSDSSETVPITEELPRTTCTSATFGQPNHPHVQPTQRDSSETVPVKEVTGAFLKTSGAASYEDFIKMNEEIERIRSENSLLKVAIEQLKEEVKKKDCEIKTLEDEQKKMRSEHCEENKRNAHDIEELKKKNSELCSKLETIKQDMKKSTHKESDDFKQLQAENVRQAHRIQVLEKRNLALENPKKNFWKHRVVPEK